MNFRYLILVSWICKLTLIGQNPVNIILNSPQPIYSSDSYTRATTSINLKPGFIYGGVTQSASNLLNLSIGTLPANISSNYAGSGINPMILNCNPVIPNSTRQVGETKGYFDVSSKGAGIYTIPIEMPPGSAGLVPKISVTYNSQMIFGLLGKGWSLNGISKIYRDNKTVIQEGISSGVSLSNNDVFSIDGNKLFSLSGNYGANGTTYYTEVESFLDITSNGIQGNGPESFIVKDRDGNTFEYGKSTDSRETGKGDNTILIWHINKIIDEFGNFINFVYKKSNDELLIDKIEFTGNIPSGTAPFGRVEFEYMTSGDKNSKFINGKEFTTANILKSISIFTEGNFFKKYTFEYNWNYGSELIQVTETDSDGSELLPTRFCWDKADPSYSEEVIPLPYTNLYAELSQQIEADLDGNGLKDKIALFSSGSTIAHQLRVYSNLGPFSTNALLQLDTKMLPNEKFIDAFVIDENNDNKEEVYIVYGVGVNSLVHNQYHLEKVYYDNSTQSTVNYQRTTYNLVANHGLGERINGGSVFFDINDYTNDGIKDKILIDPEKVIFNGSNVSYTYNYTSYGQLCRPFQFDNDAEYELIVINQSNLSNLSITILDLNISTGLLTLKYTYNYPIPGNTSFFLESISIGDLNGDNINDLAFLIVNPNINLYTIKCDGTQFLNPQNETTISNSFTNLNASFKSYLQIIDLNNDGLSDITSKFEASGYPGKFSFWSRSVIFNFINKNSAFYPAGVYENNLSVVPLSNQELIEADVDGDGIRDFSTTIFIDPANAILKEEIIKRLFSSKKRFVSRIISGYGNIIDVKYSNIRDEWSSYKDNSGKTKFDFKIYYNNSSVVYTGSDLYNYKPNLFCVHDIKYSNLQSTFNKRTKYTYSDAIVHDKGRGFLGFERVNFYTLPDESGLFNFPTYDWSGSSITTTFNNQYKYPIKSGLTIGRFSSSSQNDNFFNLYGLNQNKIFSQESYQISLLPRNSKGFFISLDQKSTKNYLESSEQTTQYTYDLNSDGNVISEIEYQGWEGNNIFTKSITRTYQLINGLYKPDLVTLSQTQLSQSSYVRSYKFNFNSNGNLISLIHDPNFGNNSLTKTFTNFTSFGQAQVETISAGDLTPRSNTTIYDNYGRYVIKKINSNNESIELTREPKYGNIIQVKDISGLITVLKYDYLGRLTEENSPSGVNRKIQYAFENINSFKYPSSSSNIGLYSITSLVEGAPKEKIYFDSYNRKLRLETESFNNSPIITDYKYSYKFDNSLVPAGLMVELTEPHFVNQTTYLIKQFEYENLAYRVLKEKIIIESPTGPAPNLFNQYNYNVISKNGLYNKKSITITDHLGRQFSKEYNSANQCDVVKNITNSVNQIANYEYHSNGQVSKITLNGPSNNITQMSYNNLGQQIQLTDPSAGVITYEYNTIGELLKQTHPATGSSNNIYTYTYDNLGRIITKAGNLSGTTTYQYANGVNGKGRIEKITGAAGPDQNILSYTYDNLGRITEKKEEIGPKSFLTKIKYNKNNNITEYIYPSGFKIKNIYSQNGYLTFINDENDNMIWKLNSQNAIGDITEYTYGNGTATQVKFDDLHYLKEIDNIGLFKQEYNFNNTTGNLSSRTFNNFITSTSLKENFMYDASDRLTQSSLVDPLTNSLLSSSSVNYSNIGNITHKDDAGDYIYSIPNKPYLLSKIDNATSNFNLDNLTIDYGDLKKAIKIEEPANQKTMHITYGVNQNRVKSTYELSNVLQYSRYYLDKHDREETGVVVREWDYVYAPSGLCAIHYNNNGNSQVMFSHTDHLGSPVILTNSSTSPLIIEEFSFDPWGRRRNPNDWSFNNVPASQNIIRGYTMHEHLDQFGLINMNARLYDPALGRFFQPDNEIQNSSNLQNLNRYSYVLNNPLLYTDPSGNFYEEEWGYDDDDSNPFPDWLGDVLVSIGLADDYARYTGNIDWADWIDEINSQNSSYSGEDSDLQLEELSFNAEDFEEISDDYVGYNNAQYEDNDIGLSAVNTFTRTPKSSTGSSDNSYTKAAAVISLGLLADDATVVGVLDDIAIPFLFLGAYLADQYNNLEFSKGGKQNIWDDELSPLSDEALKLAKEAARRAGDSQKTKKIEKEEKRRGDRNKQKRNK